MHRLLKPRRVPPPWQELSSHRKQGPGFLSRMGETVRAVANSVRGVKGRPEEFTLMQDYVDDFSNKISSVDKVTQRIIREQRGGEEGHFNLVEFCLCIYLLTSCTNSTISRICTAKFSKVVLARVYT